MFVYDLSNVGLTFVLDSTSFGGPFGPSHTAQLSRDTCVTFYDQGTCAIPNDQNQDTCVIHNDQASGIALWGRFEQKCNCALLSKLKYPAMSHSDSSKTSVHSDTYPDYLALLFKSAETLEDLGTNFISLDGTNHALFSDTTKYI